MTQPIHLNDLFYAVELPDFNSDYVIQIEDGRSIILVGDRNEHYWPIINLPPGTWTFLFTTKGATEEQAASVVESVDKYFFKCYDDHRPHLSGKASLECLMLKNGLKLQFNHAILKLNDNEQ